MGEDPPTPSSAFHTFLQPAELSTALTWRAASRPELIKPEKIKREERANSVQVENWLL